MVQAWLELPDGTLVPMDVTIGPDGHAVFVADDSEDEES